MYKMIPQDLIFRVYGDSLAVIVDLVHQKVTLLQKKALEVWLEIASGEDIQNYPAKIVNQLKKYRLIQAEETEIKESLGDIETQGIEQIEVSVLNYWAFKNHIPISGHFELTSRCNLRCKHCYTIFEKKDTLSTEQIYTIIDHLHQAGTIGLVLTGGEIFQREDIIEILEYLYQKRFVLRLNTNGVFIDKEMVQKMKHFSNIQKIHISLYSADAKTHDTITNQKGSYQKTLRAIELLKEAGFNLRINCSLMQENKDSYQEIRTQIGERLGVEVHYDPFIYPQDDGGFLNMERTFTDSQVEEFDIFEKRDNSKPSSQPKLCKAGFSFFSVTENGDLYPCLKMKRCYSRPLGNLVEQSLQQIWHRSQKLRDVRVQLEEQIRDCSICSVSI